MQAPEITATLWINSDAPLRLKELRGRVVMLHAFQMLCPACVSHGLPQAMKAQSTFPGADVMVIGLHSVFEHHDAMNPEALRAFLSEYRIPFPVAVDMPSDKGYAIDPIPQTMRAYELRGTPSVVLIDRRGDIRLRHLGVIDDLSLGAMLGKLAAERTDATSQAQKQMMTSTPPETASFQRKPAASPSVRACAASNAARFPCS